MNLSQMQKAIIDQSIRDIERMDIDELRAELTHFYEKEISNMDSEEIRATYNYLMERVIA
jgi:hypothetical protein